ncbi:Dehydrogenase E1 component [Penicillium fimorum]|uniref:Dehydrogenase E1 component n=1 Tax=Penicillium fimorum TaxID=1882269 RepID=A0A9W9XJ07_9EURO|nr:Dehydrogenase E1 component [Penicillium fimorum]
MSTPDHIQAAIALHNAVTETFRPMELFQAAQAYGGVNVSVGHGKQKQPDAGWGATRPPCGVPKRPGVVVEVGLSEPETKLCNDARMWVDPVRGEAKMTITVKVNRRKPELNLHTWEWELRSTTSAGHTVNCYRKDQQ